MQPLFQVVLPVIVCILPCLFVPLFTPLLASLLASNRLSYYTLRHKRHPLLCLRPFKQNKEGEKEKEKERRKKETGEKKRNEKKRKNCQTWLSSWASENRPFCASSPSTCYRCICCTPLPRGTEIRFFKILPFPVWLDLQHTATRGLAR